jgi:hypothetical protein
MQTVYKHLNYGQPVTFQSTEHVHAILEQCARAEHQSLEDFVSHMIERQVQLIDYHAQLMPEKR